jgi:hypothetical protein
MVPVNVSAEVVVLEAMGFQSLFLWMVPVNRDSLAFLFKTKACLFSCMLKFI